MSFLKHPLQLVADLVGAQANPPIPIPTPVMSPGVTAVVANSAEAAKAATAQVQTIPGICGYMPSETGTPDFVCQALGQTMPGIVFFVSMTVVILTVVFLFRYLLRCLKANSQLKELLRDLNQQKSLSPHEVANPEHVKLVIASLDRCGKKLPALAPFSRKLEESFIQVDDLSRGQLLSKSVPEIAEKNLSLSDWTGKNLADEIPNWLTAAGLLTTFIAILLGLQHVKVLTNLEVQGISGLVNGLSGKFFSSIVALSCALTVTIANHFISEKLNAVWSQILLKLEALLPYLNTEQMLFDLLKERQRKKSQP